MVTRASLVSLVAAFIGLSGLVCLFPLISELVNGPVIGTFAAPSHAERILNGARDLLFCGSLVLAYLLWLRRQTARYILCCASFCIGVVPILLQCCARFPNPIFDAVAIALRDAIPWFFFASLLCHPSLAIAFAQPIPIRFSVRCFLLV